MHPIGAPADWFTRQASPVRGLAAAQEMFISPFLSAFIRDLLRLK
jgi:hypothetical protein